MKKTVKAFRHPRRFAPEFKGRLVELVRAGRTLASVGREFDVSPQVIGQWLRQAERDDGQRSDGVTTDERTELQRLRRENARLREERDILKKAAAWFARETGAITPESSDS